MYTMPNAERLNMSDISEKQLAETVNQELEGVTCRMAVITCPCGQKRAIVKMYRCLYCKTWFCHQCAEQHFGKTVDQYYKD